MSEYCVVVAGGSKARILTLEPVEFPELQSGPNLVEHATLENPEHRAHDAQVLAELRSGRNRAAFGPAHGYDDHRQQHDKEVDKRFARDIASELDRIVHTNGFQHVVLCADKRMLGMLRPSLAISVGAAVDVHEVPKDLGKLNCRQIHDRLAEDGHLPARRRRSA